MLIYFLVFWYSFCAFCLIVGLRNRKPDSSIMLAFWGITALTAILAGMFLTSEWLMAMYLPGAKMKLGSEGEWLYRKELIANFSHWCLPLLCLAFGHWFGNRLKERNDEPMYVENVKLYW